VCVCCNYPNFFPKKKFFFWMKIDPKCSIHQISL
jgi:hypothetical protein